MDLVAVDKQNIIIFAKIGSVNIRKRQNFRENYQMLIFLQKRHNLNLNKGIVFMKML
jgi:hypothetical protein